MLFGLPGRTPWHRARVRREPPVTIAYRALERKTARLFELVCRSRSLGGLGVRVHHARDAKEPYRYAAELCAELREHGSMTVATFGMTARDEPHPLLGDEAYITTGEKPALHADLPPAELLAACGR